MVYLVVKGDTWASIAKQYHTTEQHLRDINQWPDGALHAGARLLVDGYCLHLVLPGEDDACIADQYAVAVDTLRRANPEGWHPFCRIKIPV